MINGGNIDLFMVYILTVKADVVEGTLIGKHFLYQKSLGQPGAPQDSH